MRAQNKSAAEHRIQTPGSQAQLAVSLQRRHSVRSAQALFFLPKRAHTYSIAEPGSSTEPRALPSPALCHAMVALARGEIDLHGVHRRRAARIKLTLSTSHWHVIIQRIVIVGRRWRARVAVPAAESVVQMRMQ